MRWSAPLILILLAAAASLLPGVPAPAAAAQLNLNVNPASITFPDLNPDLSPSVPSTPATVRVRIRVRMNGGQPWQLTLAANDHLRSGADVITVDNVTWTTTPAAPPWTAGGTLALAPGQMVASGTGNVNPPETADLAFRLANRWTYAVGTYTTTATFTLSAP
ncbi:MAG TPA: hypothetical protein VNM66_00770 [Thermodesulfobacteriota bacterium]|nr:hypothetical protein [Thermodesulfobacteriota bacterium]